MAWLKIVLRHELVGRRDRILHMPGLMRKPLKESVLSLASFRLLAIFRRLMFPNQSYVLTMTTVTACDRHYSYPLTLPVG